MQCALYIWLCYLSEKRNLNIYVADNDAGAVVVVNAAGKLRFGYTGPPSTPLWSFTLYGITTDSQANILTSDCDNHLIHIIDRDGKFFFFIQNCCLQDPRGLCVDSRDNLFVAEWKTVKKLLYYRVDISNEYNHVYIYALYNKKMNECSNFHKATNRLGICLHVQTNGLCICKRTVCTFTCVNQLDIFKCTQT